MCTVSEPWIHHEHQFRKRTENTSTETKYTLSNSQQQNVDVSSGDDESEISAGRRGQVLIIFVPWRNKLLISTAWNASSAHQHWWRQPLVLPNLRRYLIGISISRHLDPPRRRWILKDIRGSRGSRGLGKSNYDFPVSSPRDPFNFPTNTYEKNEIATGLHH
jgi:hypothetical protein